MYFFTSFSICSFLIGTDCPVQGIPINGRKLLIVTTDMCTKARQRENAPKTAIGVAQRHFAKVDRINLDVINLHLMVR